MPAFLTRNCPERAQYTIRRGRLNGIYATSVLDRRHSALRPVNFTTLAHLSVSSAISLLKSAGEPASGSPPMSANLAFIAVSEKAALISLLSLSVISTDVLVGAPMPYHWLPSYPGPKTPP